MDADDFHGLTTKGLALRQLGRDEEEQATLLCALELVDGSTDRTRHGQALGMAGRLQEAEDVLRRGLARTKLPNPLNYMEVGQCCAARYCQLIHRGGEELKYGTLFLPRPPLYWRETGKTNYEELVAAARDRLKYAAVAFRFAVQLQPFVLNVRALVSGALVYEEIYHYEPGPAARTAASESEGNPAVDKGRQDEVDAICEQMGELGELSEVQQLRCLEEEQRNLKEFRLFDQAAEVQNLHAWKAKKVAHAKAAARRRLQAAAGKLAESAAGDPTDGGLGSLGSAIDAVTAAAAVSPRRAVHSHLGRLLLMRGLHKEEAEGTGSGSADFRGSIRQFVVARELAQIACATSDPGVEPAPEHLPDTFATTPGEDSEEFGVLEAYHFALATVCMQASSPGAPGDDGLGPADAGTANVGGAVDLGAQLSSLTAGEALRCMEQGLALADAMVARGKWGPNRPPVERRLTSARPLRADNPLFVRGHLHCGLLRLGRGQRKVAAFHFRCVMGLVPHLLTLTCRAPDTTVRLQLTRAFGEAQVRKTPSWPRSWANFRPL